MAVTKSLLTANFFEQSGQPFERVLLRAILYGVDVEGQDYVARDTQETYSDVAGVATLELFANAAGTRYSYYRITATTPQGVVISDSNVSMPAANANLVDVEGNWSGEVFTGGSNAIITGNLTVSGTTTLNNLLGNLSKISGLFDYSDDVAAASGGIQVNGLYRTGSVVKVRVS